jgi:hypothetical protein
MSEQPLERIAQEFWTAAGGPEPFPRCLDGAIAWTLPLAVTRLPRLWVRDVADWFHVRDMPFWEGGPDRPLHACLIAYGGNGWALLDGADPVDEQRFSLAHEVAHFLLDYLEPRRAAVQRLGKTVLEVFDGRRPPTVAERVDAVLRDVSIGAHMQLMERRPNGEMGCGRVAGAEGRADRLAFELLAPAAEVKRWVALPGRPANFAAGERRIVAALIETFGLPRPAAALYARWLARDWWGGPSVREWLAL